MLQLSQEIPPYPPECPVFLPNPLPPQKVEPAGLHLPAFAKESWVPKFCQGTCQRQGAQKYKRHLSESVWKILETAIRSNGLLKYAKSLHFAERFQKWSWNGSQSKWQKVLEVEVQRQAGQEAGKWNPTDGTDFASLLLLTVRRARQSQSPTPHSLGPLPIWGSKCVSAL